MIRVHGQRTSGTSMLSSVDDELITVIGDRGQQSLARRLQLLVCGLTHAPSDEALGNT